MIGSLLLGLILASSGNGVGADARLIEFRFQLSADAGSEFSARVPLLSPGFLTIKADWRSLASSGENSSAQTKLILALVRPDGTEAARTSGPAPLNLEMRVSESDIARSSDRGRAWTVKILNGVSDSRREVAGTLRVTVPITRGRLIDTGFTLMGQGNAQELPFNLSAPGKLIVEANWQTDSPTERSAPSVLSLSLIHAGEERIYARRQGPSPLRIEQPITEQSLDRGARWSVRILNEGRIKVKGALKVTFAPGL